MKRFLKQTLALLLVVILIGGAAPLTVGAEEKTTYKVGAIIEFGSYPQTKVTKDTLINALNAQTDVRSQEWRFYSYYSGLGEDENGTMKVSDYMEYIDIHYSGDTYRGVRFSQYRPSWTGGTHDAIYSDQDENGYYPNTTYWFLWQPLQWCVLDPGAGLVLCKTIIDNQPFNNYSACDGSNDNGLPYQACWGDESKTYYANNYAKSSIRDWLTKESDETSFLNTAFTKAQRDAILDVTLDNSASNTLSSAYDSASTTDKIYLLSWTDIQNPAYACDAITYNSDPKLQVKGSDYAKCQGLYNGASDPNPDQCPSWWLRTPGVTSFCACYVSQTGLPFNLDRTGDTTSTYGVRPAMRLKSLTGLEVDHSFSVRAVELSDLTLNYKSSVSVNPSISADSGVRYTIQYESSDPDVAKVNENGTVYAGKTGEATLTAIVTDQYGNVVKDTCKVTVKYAWWQILIRIFLLGFIWY